MGTYLNPGKQSYEMAVNSEIFVDKTEMIQYLNSVVNTQQRFLSVSRPRRFGKTMAADMICAYYSRETDSRQLFVRRKIAKTERVRTGNNEIPWDGMLGKFDVIRLVMTDFMDNSDSVQGMLDYMTEEVVDELKEAFPNVNFGSRITLRTVLNKIYGKTGHQFVIVIDEWDAVFRTWKEDNEGQTKYLDFLRELLKDKPYIALAYMTGILPIKKYGEHSALNMFDEYSMIQPMRMAEYVGFTESEVRKLCDEYEMEFDEVSKWYDGYRITDYIPVGKRKEFRIGEYSDHKISVYSPLSVVKAMTNGIVDNYWNKTETYEALADYIRMDYDGLKDTVALLMDGGRVKVSLKSYQNDMTTFQSRDDVLALLIHLGYLGFEGDEAEGRIDSEHGEVFIPNSEILEVFRTSTESSEWLDTFESFRISQELLKATWNKDAEKVAELIEKAHNKADNKTYNDEAALSYSIRLAYYAAQKYYTILPEADTGKGYADLILLPTPEYADKPALVIELKYNKDADGAVKQIKGKDYPDRLEHYKGNILLVGINYEKDIPNTDPNYKHHSCIIEEG